MARTTCRRFTSAVHGFIGVNMNLNYLLQHKRKERNVKPMTELKVPNPDNLSRRALALQYIGKYPDKTAHELEKLTGIIIQSIYGAACSQGIRLPVSPIKTPKSDKVREVLSKKKGLTKSQTAKAAGCSIATAKKVGEDMGYRFKCGVTGKWL